MADTPANRTVTRDEKGRFVKGTSGNPYGRPKTREDMRALANLAPDRLIALLDSEDTSTEQKMRILTWAWENVYGKAPQGIMADIKTTVRNEMTADEMEQVIRQASELG